MNIIFNARFLHLSKTGIGQYCINLIKSLSQLDLKNHYLFVIDKELPADEVNIYGHFEHKVIPQKRFLIHKDLKKTFWEQVQFANFIKNFKESIIHIPYIAPPFKKKNKVILTIHDLAPLVFAISKSGRNGIYDKCYLNLLLKAIERVDFIIADSESTKIEIIKYLNYSHEKIEVIHLAADEYFKPINNAKRYEEIKRKYSITKNYILYLGDSSYRKNVLGLINAYHMLSGELKKKFDLVLCGNTINSKQLTKVAKNIEGDRIKFIGFADKEDIPVLYSYAYLFVFPTIYEGFGLPPLEAMSCGTPVISSTFTSIPEVVGGAGILIDTHNVVEMCLSMTRVLTEAQLRDELIEKGLERAKKFTWNDTAAKTLQVYEKVYSKI